MGNILKAKLTIQGTRPLWQHRFGPEALPLEKQEKTGVAGNDPEDWRRTCMVTNAGQLYVDGSYIFGCLKEAARYTKQGKASIQKSMAATLQVLTDRVTLNRWFPGFPAEGLSFDPKKAEPPATDTSLPVHLDVRGVVNPSTKGRNVRYRLACSPGWQAEAELLWDKTIVSRSEMEAVAIDAGRLVGIGSGRSVGMGRFDLVSFEVSEV